MPDGILARVPHEVARYGARISQKKGGRGVIHVKLKSWLRSLGPVQSHIWISTSSPASYGIPGWLGLPSIPQPLCPPVYDLVGWSGKVQEGHSFRWWYLCGVLENGSPTCVQSPQCTLSMNTWCTTSNKPRVQCFGRSKLNTSQRQLVSVRERARCSFARDKSRQNMTRAPGYLHNRAVFFVFFLVWLRCFLKTLSLSI